MNLAAKFLTTGLTILACVLLLSELGSVVAIATDVESFYDDSRAITRLFCHQLPSRCPWFDGRPTVLCFRCIGLYSGIVAGPLVSRLRFRGGRKHVIGLGLLALLPSLVELLVDRLIDPGIAASLRWVTGFSFGLGFIALLSLVVEKRSMEQAIGRVPA